jgi:thiol-disulfide isomerase/thioredoxin
MQEAAERAAQHAKELHDKEFERVRAESAQHQGSGGGDTEVQEELKRRAKLAGQGASKPYEVLGVQVSATRSEIKKAYRRLSLLLHPDKVKDPKQKVVAQSVFMDIVAAYEVLGSEDKRQAFDDLGDADGTKKETFNTYWEYQKFGNKKTKANNDFFTGHPFIVNLNSATWNRRVTGSSVWLVDFYAPWCSHCVDMVPEYKKEQILKCLYIHTMYTYLRSTDLENLLECVFPYYLTMCCLGADQKVFVLLLRCSLTKVFSSCVLVLRCSLIRCFLTKVFSYCVLLLWCSLPKVFSSCVFLLRCSLTKVFSSCVLFMYPQVAEHLENQESLQVCALVVV